MYRVKLFRYFSIDLALMIVTMKLDKKYFYHAERHASLFVNIRLLKKMVQYLSIMISLRSLAYMYYKL